MWGDIVKQHILFELIMETAKKDDRIRAVAMTGSRIDPNAAHDEFCDFDIVFIVNDIKSFTTNDDWLDVFGEKLIMQKSSDRYTTPHNYDDFENYTYLIHLKDGNRIDLTLIDVLDLHSYILNQEPRTILLDKDKFIGLSSTEAGDYFSIKKPTEEEFSKVCNQFWWMVPNIVKGLCRKQLPYVKVVMEQFAMDDLLEVLNWCIGIDSNFSVGTGKWNKYLEKHLEPEVYKEFVEVFPNGHYLDIWEKLMSMCNLFQKQAIKVAGYFDFPYNKEKADEIMNYAAAMKLKYYGNECDNT